MLDLRQLRYFVVVAEQEHVGRAADILNITQSPLSRQIIDLEARLGLQLFRRANKRLYLTQTGRSFLADAQALIAQSDRLARKVQQMAAGEAGTLLLGYVDGALHSGVLGGALKTLRDALPEVDVQIKSHRTGDQMHALASGALDFGIAYSPARDRPELSSERLFEEHFKLAARAEDAPAGRATAGELDGKPFIWHQPANAPNADQAMLHACASAGFRPDIRHEASSPLAALDMVAAGLGFALVQSSLERAAPTGVCFVDMPQSFAARVSIYLLHRSEMTQLEQRARAQIRVSATRP